MKECVYYCIALIRKLLMIMIEWSRVRICHHSGLFPRQPYSVRSKLLTRQGPGVTFLLT